MKRVTLFLTLIIVVVLTSCSARETVPTAVHFGVLHDSSSFEIPQDKNDSGLPHWDKSSFIDESAPQVMTVAFEGKEYTGKYVTTMYVNGDLHFIDYYISEEEPVSFYTNHTTGKLIYFRITHNDPESTGKAKKTLSELQGIADSYAAEFIDKADYEIEINEEENLVVFDYVKYCGDLPTVEKLTIQVMRTGEFISFYAGNIGTIKNEELKKQHNLIETLKEAAPRVVDERIRLLYGEWDNYGHYEKEITKLCKLTDGSFGILYKINVFYKKPKEMCDTVWIMVRDQEK